MGDGSQPGPAPAVSGGLGAGSEQGTCHPELLLLHHGLVTALWCSMPQQSIGHHATPRDTVLCHTVRRYATARGTVPSHAMSHNAMWDRALPHVAPAQRRGSCCSCWDHPRAVSAHDSDVS